MNGTNWHQPGKHSKISFVLHIILSFLYIPLSFFSILLFMASELTIGATDQTFVALVTVFCYIAISIPVLCIICMTVSARLRKKEKAAASVLVQLLPLAVFLLNLVFASVIDTRYR